MYFLLTNDNNKLDILSCKHKNYNTYPICQDDLCQFNKNHKFIRFILLPHSYKFSPRFWRYETYYDPIYINTKDLIIGDPINLFSIKTIKFLEKLQIEIGPSYINGVFSTGDINLIEYLCKKYINLFIQDLNTYLYTATDNNHLHVLEWFKNSKLLSNNYSSMSIECCSSKGNIKILEWWKNSGLPLEYTETALDKASENGHVNVLEWWLNSNLPLKYSKLTLHNNVSILKWLHKANLLDEFINKEYSSNLIIKLSHYTAEELDWLMKTALEYKKKDIKTPSNT